MSNSHPTTAQKRWVLIATILGSSVVFINQSAVNVALPALQTALEAPVVVVQWVVNGYLLTLASLILLGGSLGDHFGRRRVFVLGAALFAVTALWAGLAPNAGQLIAARVVQGFAGALMTPGSLALISATFREEERGRAIGLWSGFSAMTTALGPIVGGVLTDLLSWRWVFLIVVPLLLVVIAVSLWRVPESRSEEARGLDGWGAVLATVALALVTFGLLESQVRAIQSLRVWAPIFAGIGVFGGFLWTEHRSRHPMMPLQLFRSSTFRGANSVTLFLYMALGGALFFLPFNLIQVQGFTATQAGLALLPVIGSITVLSRWAGGLIERVGARPPLVIGPAITAVGFALLAVPGAQAGYWTGFFPGLLAVGIGMGVAVAPLTTSVMNAVPESRVGTASGVNNAVARLANLLAVALFGLVVIAVFVPSLDTRLSGLDLPTEARAQIEAERTDLAATEPPDTLPEDVQAEVRDAIDASYVDGFRWAMLSAALLAAASAGIAAVTIREEEATDTAGDPAG